jgi:hypothetical protein
MVNGTDDPARDTERDHTVAEDDHAPAIEVAADPVATARRRHGAAGALVAAGMLGLDQVLGRKPREEAPVVVAASDQPIDIDDEGIVVAIDEQTSVVAPPQPRPDPLPPRRRRRTRG